MDLRFTIYDLRLERFTRLVPARSAAASHASRFAVLAFWLLAFSGCGRPQTQVPAPARPTVNPGDTAASNPQSAIRNPQPEPSVAGFGPAKISILPLSELTGSSGAGPNATLDVYVALLDAFGSPIKGPGVLRFELYEYVSRSADPRGQRVIIWSDYDLTSPVENNKYWRDFLRAYEFELDVRADPGKTYILEVTCLCPDGRRLTGNYMLKGSATATRQPSRTDTK